MNMAISAILFAIFFLNVFLGASGRGAFLGNVHEMLLLTLSALFFVAGILSREAEAKKNKK